MPGERCKKRQKRELTGSGGLGLERGKHRRPAPERERDWRAVERCAGEVEKSAENGAAGDWEAALDDAGRECASKKQAGNQTKPRRLPLSICLPEGQRRAPARRRTAHHSKGNTVRAIRGSWEVADGAASRERGSAMRSRWVAKGRMASGGTRVEGNSSWARIRLRAGGGGGAADLQ
jgi:hypothetical protein